MRWLHTLLGLALGLLAVSLLNPASGMAQTTVAQKPVFAILPFIKPPPPNKAGFRSRPPGFLTPRLHPRAIRMSEGAVYVLPDSGVWGDRELQMRDVKWTRWGSRRPDSQHHGVPPFCAREPSNPLKCYAIGHGQWRRCAGETPCSSWQKLRIKLYRPVTAKCASPTRRFWSHMTLFLSESKYRVRTPQNPRKEEVWRSRELSPCNGSSVAAPSA